VSRFKLFIAAAACAAAFAAPAIADQAEEIGAVYMELSDKFGDLGSRVTYVMTSCTPIFGIEPGPADVLARGVGALQISLSVMAKEDGALEKARELIPHFEAEYRRFSRAVEAMETRCGYR
jgi:hypothetical protein